MPAEMRHFRAIPGGWLRGTPSKETLEWAQRFAAEGDKRKPNTMENFSERRYQGFVAERAFDLWLEQEQVEHRWNGDTDARPDFALGPVRVGVKCCGSRAPWRSKLVVNVYERHREHALHELFFVGFEHPGGVKPGRPTVVLLGGLPKEEYFERATHVPAGGKLNPTVIAKNEVWNLPTAALQPPADWLSRVRRRMREDVG